MSPENMLKDHDDRFEITGEILISLPDGSKVEFERVLFAWKLYNKEDDSSIESIMLLLEGGPEELKRFLGAIWKDQAFPKEDGPRAAVILRMKKDLVKEVKRWAAKRSDQELPVFLVGQDRMTKVFDFSNYEVISTHRY